jgi:uncharacterized protein (DUF362 family)
MNARVESVGTFMLRRQWIGLAAGAIASAWQRGQAQNAADTMVAGPSQATPRVGIVLSSFSGAEDHDGTKLSGLRNPVSPESPAGDDLLDEMVRMAIEVGNTVNGGLARIVEEQDWVVIKPHLAVCQRSDGRFVPGSVADLRVVRSVVEWLAEHGLGSRITIAGAPSWSMDRAFDPWASEWDGVFGKTSYRLMVEELGRRYPSIRFDIADLTEGETMALQPPGGFTSSSETATVFDFPTTLLTCNKLINIAPLSTSSWTDVSLTIGSYFGVLPSGRHDRLRENPLSGDPHELVADLFSLRPPDYAILGGEQGLEGDGPYGPDAAPVHHNLILAGANGVAVDAVGSAIMGLDPAGIKHLQLAAQRGLGTTDTSSIWIRGNEIDEAKRPFRPATRPPTHR